MRIIVTHHSPDLDAITSIWLIKKFLPGWQEAKVRFVPAGERLQGALASPHPVIENINEDEVIHVDTGLGPLDHHQTESDSVSAASLTLDFVKRGISRDKVQALRRMVKVVVDIDHFKEALWPQPLADYHEFSLPGIIEGLRHEFPNKDKLHVNFIMKCLDTLLAHFENRVWAEEEIKKGIKFRVKGLPAGRQGIGFETINDAVLPLAQKVGFSIVLRKDPRKGYVRIKVRPDKDFDLTPVYEKLRQLDPEASWFLHVSKKMLLNGTTKNPKMKATRLSLKEIIEVLELI